MTKTISNSLTNRINSLSVPGVGSNTANTEESTGSITAEELKAMLESMPMNR